MLKRNHIIYIQKNKKSKNIKKIYAKFAEFAKKFLNSADNFVLFFVHYAENIYWGILMKSKTIVLTSALFSLFAAAFFTGCKDDVYTMLEDYNSNYEPATNMDIIINPGDEGFIESNMLDPTYFVSSEGSINIAAPYNCQSYEWAFYEIIYHQQGSQSAITSTLHDITDGLDFYPDCGKDKREFRAYVPRSRISADEKLTAGTYILHLLVVGNDGNKYKDWCSIVIYEQVYGQDSFFKED